MAHSFPSLEGESSRDSRGDSDTWLKVPPCYCPLETNSERSGTWRPWSLNIPAPVNVELCVVLSWRVPFTNDNKSIQTCSVFFSQNQVQSTLPDASTLGFPRMVGSMPPFVFPGGCIWKAKWLPPPPVPWKIGGITGVLYCRFFFDGKCADFLKIFKFTTHPPPPRMKELKRNHRNFPWRPPPPP